MNYGVHPIRPWRDFYLTESGFLSQAYFDKFNRWHRGVDINKKSGGDSDLGYPVQSMFPGVVTYAEAPKGSSWGGIVVIRTEQWLTDRIAAYLNIELPILDMQYAHLMQISAEYGTMLNAGDHIGSIGKGAYNQYIAHLHLEARRQEFAPAAPQGNTDEHKDIALETCIDPALLLSIPLGDYSDMVPSGRRELAWGRLFMNDVLDGGGLVVTNRVSDKVYVKRTSEWEGTK